jgi:uncharacterized protein YutE (UPF0331/DUF86 family)
VREFIPTNEFKNEEILSALEWYFESKNYHLEEALKIVTPMSSENVRHLRISYSNYFISLMSAIEILLDDNYKHKNIFYDYLIKEFSFEGFTDGKNNYKYLRELRNCIVHRGYNITCAAHTPDGHPMLLAPESIPTRNDKAEYFAFGKYILEIVSRIESVFGNIVYSHIKNVDLFKPTYSESEQLKLIQEFITKTNIMPEPFKKMALEAIPKIKLESMEKRRFNRFEKILKFNVLSDKFV